MMMSAPARASPVLMHRDHMRLLGLFNREPPRPGGLPEFIKSAENIHGVRVLRRRGEVGPGIGAAVQRRVKQA